MKSPRRSRNLGGRLAMALPLLWVGGLGFGTAGAQVSILPGSLASDWRPILTLTLGDTIELLGHGLSLSLDPGHILESGPGVPGGLRAALRFRTDLQMAVRASAGLRAIPLRVSGPTELLPLGEAPPLLGPGAEYLFWETGESGAAWGFARVLEVGSDHVRLELVECAPGCTAFERDPLGLEFETPTTLSWIPSTSDASSSQEVPRYRVDRRDFGEATWSQLAEVLSADSDGIYRWQVPPVGAALPAVHEYRVTRTDPNEDEGAGPGSTSLHVGATLRHLPYRDDAATVAPGSSVELISGRSVESGALAHVTVGRASPGAIVLTPKPGVRLSRVASKVASSGKKTRAADGSILGTWRLPGRADPSWLPGKAVVMRDGGEVAFLLENGLRGRISVAEIGSERWVLRRELSIDDTGLLPRPPAAPLKIVAEAATGPDFSQLLLSFAAPGPGTKVDPADVAFVLESELPLGSGHWRTLAITGPGSSSIDVPGAFRAEDGSRLPLLRLRLRHRILFGSESTPSSTFDVLSSGSDLALREVDLGAALASLASDSFPVRLEAHAVIEAIGDDARHALEALATTSGSSPGGLAALEILRSLDERGGGGARLGAQLRVLALESLRSRGFQPTGGDVQAWLGDMPDGLASGRPDQRAHALLLAIDRAERGVAMLGPKGSAGATVGDDCERALAWAYATATIDPDEGVRWLARFIGEIGLTPSLASFEPEGPAWLLPPARRSSAERLDFGWGEQPGSAEELRWQLEARPELASLKIGFALARLHAALKTPTTFLDYDVRTAELVLRLVERSRAPGGGEVLLRAAESLLPGAEYTLDAWRSVTDRRLASPSPVVVGRERIVLESHDLMDLQAALSEADGHVGMDFVLSEGDWTFGADEGAKSGAPSLELRTDDVRLMAAAGARVRVHAGLRVHGWNVVLENLVVAQSVGQAITVLNGGHAVFIGGELRGAGTVIHLQDGDLELYETRVAPVDPASLPATAARLILGSRLFARATLFEAGSLFVSAGAEAWLDRCVLDAGPRMLVQSQKGGRLFVRESLLRGEGSGLFRVSSGLLAGTVIDVPRDPLGRLPQSRQDGGLRVSPRLLRLVQEGQDVPPDMQLDMEPLGANSRPGSPRPHAEGNALRGR